MVALPAVGSQTRGASEVEELLLSERSQPDNKIIAAQTKYSFLNMGIFLENFEF